LDIAGAGRTGRTARVLAASINVILFIARTLSAHLGADNPACEAVAARLGKPQQITLS
jgi:hypothetical protein